MHFRRGRPCDIRISAYLRAAATRQSCVMTVPACQATRDAGASSAGVKGRARGRSARSRPTSAPSASRTCAHGDMQMPHAVAWGYANAACGRMGICKCHMREGGGGPSLRGMHAYVHCSAHVYGECISPQRAWGYAYLQWARPIQGMHIGARTRIGTRICPMGRPMRERDTHPAKCPPRTGTNSAATAPVPPPPPPAAAAAVTAPPPSASGAASNRVSAARSSVAITAPSDPDRHAADRDRAPTAARPIGLPSEPGIHSCAPRGGVSGRHPPHPRGGGGGGGGMHNRIGRGAPPVASRRRAAGSPPRHQARQPARPQ